MLIFCDPPGSPAAPHCQPYGEEASRVLAISSEFPFASRYVDVDGSRLHYVEEGVGDPVLFLHGNPTSSYLWRNVIPHVAAESRAIALDLVGMGRSDRPDSEYRFFDHVRYVEGFIEALELDDLTLVVHDWGSALGFHYASRNESRVRGIAFMEAIVAPVPSWDAFLDDARDLFRAFRTPGVGEQLIMEENVFVERVLPGSVVRELTDDEMARYREPFPDPPSRKPLWRWPNEIPIEGEPPDVHEAVQAYNAWIQRTDTPMLMFVATPGVLLSEPMVRWCRDHIRRLEVVELGEGIHYLQEDHPDEIGTAIAEWQARL